MRGKAVKALRRKFVATIPSKMRTTTTWRHFKRGYVSISRFKKYKLLRSYYKPTAVKATATGDTIKFLDREVK